MKHVLVRSHRGRLHDLEAGKVPAVALLHSASAFQIDDPALFVCAVNRRIDLTARKQVR